MINNFLRFFTLLSTFALAIYSYQLNPEFYNFDSNYFEILKTPSTSPAVVYKTLVSSCEATAQYRYNEKRTGVAPENFTPLAQAKIIEHIAFLNTDIHDASKSSPTVDDSGVYVGTDAGWFYKMNHDGKILWQFYIPDSLNGIHGSAALDDKKVYIGAYNGMMYALDKENGDVVWVNPVADFIGASPLLANGGLFISAETNYPDGLVARLDCNTGETVWVSQWLGGHSHSSPTYDLQTNSILVGANSGRLFSFHFSDGKTLWEKQFHGQIKGTPMIHQSHVFFGSWDKKYHALDVKTGEEKWSQFMGGRIQTSLSLVPQANLGLTNTKVGDITALNLLNGEIMWRLRQGDPNHQFSILVTNDSKRKNEFLAWSRCKENYLCVLDAKTGNILNTIELPGPFTSVPFAYKDKIYISLDKEAGLIVLQ